MRAKYLIIPFVFALIAVAQIGPPSLGVAGGAGKRIVEIQGIPEAWVARPVLDASADAAASSSAELCWTQQGILNISNRRSHNIATYPVPEGDARFAFDTGGQLAAVWFLKSGEVYTRSAGWNAVYANPSSAAPLDLTVTNSRVLTLLYRTEAGLHRTRISPISGAVLAESKLEDLSGPALLDSSGNAVFALSSGVSEVDSIRRVEQGWTLLTTTHGLWMWQPGKQPQGVPNTAGATPALQFWAPNGSKDVGASFALPNTPVGSTTREEPVLSNPGQTDIYLSSFHMTTTSPFRLVGAPSTPWRIGAGMLQGFFIDFSPKVVGAASTSLTLNYCDVKDFDAATNLCSVTQARSIAITGTGLVAPASGPWLTGISPESNMAGAPPFTVFVNGGGFTSSSTVLWNGTALATTFISSLQLSAAITPELVAAPNDAKVTVSNPPGGTANSTKPWTFHVYSSLTPRIEVFDQNDAPISPSQFTSNKTVRVRVKLDQAAPNLLSGVLELGFQSALLAITSDQSIALGSPGTDSQVGNLQQFRFPAGATTALFGNADYVSLTTGTTAGTIMLAIDVQSAVPTTAESYVIDLAPPTITSSTKISTGATVVLKLEGYDNTRSLSGIAFTFRTVSGGVVAPGAISVDVAKAFADYFQTNSQIGGSFLLTATFPVAGDIAQIGAVTAVVTSGAGTTSTTAAK